MALIGINDNGEEETHIASTIGNYITLCGLDTDAEDLGVTVSKAEKKVTCRQCIGIWKTAREIKARQIGKAN